MLTVVVGLYFAGLSSVLGSPFAGPNPISLRCESLVKERNEKVLFKQKVTVLLERSEKLIKALPKNKKSSLDRARSTKRRLLHEIYLTGLRIHEMDENMIRSGCPGVRY